MSQSSPNALRAARRRPTTGDARDRRGGRRDYEHRARARLRRFRQSGPLAVGATGFLLLLWELAAVQTPDPAVARASDPSRSVEEATSALRQVLEGFYGFLPKLLIALAVLLAAILLARAARALVRRVLGSWERSQAVGATVTILVWVFALGASLSVVAGDARALVGSVGIFGLALSWTLQAPIESFAGWILNSFRSYYRVGDQIGVGEVYGDVYRMDFLTTTVWETSPARRSPTGALITFPNSEVLRSNVVNYTRDFPYVWDEVTVGVTNESDLAYALEVAGRCATRVVGERMAGPAQEYAALLRREGLAMDVAAEPRIFARPASSWTDITVRYLVPVRERRQWISDLYVALSQELTKSDHRGRLEPAYPRAHVTLEGPEASPSTFGNPR